MTMSEAKEILARKLRELRRVPYEELEELSHEVMLEEVKSDSGTVYYLEAESIVEDRRRGHMRVLVSIHDGGLRSFVPLSDDFIVAKDGSFIGE
jgi:hypothetical protein